MENLSTMTPSIVIGKIMAFEISRNMGQDEASSSSKGKALASSEKKKMKGKQVETSSSSNSSSEDEEEEDDDDDDEEEDSSDDDQSSFSTSDLDEESITLINKVEKMIKGSISRVCLSKSKILFSPIKEMSKERNDAMDAASWGTLWKFVQTRPHLRQTRRV